MKWNMCNFFTLFTAYLPKSKRQEYNWGCDQMRKILMEVATLAQKNGDTELAEGFKNICIYPPETI